MKMRLLKAPMTIAFLLTLLALPFDNSAGGYQRAHGCNAQSDLRYLAYELLLGGIALTILTLISICTQRPRDYRRIGSTFGVLVVQLMLSWATPFIITFYFTF